MGAPSGPQVVVPGSGWVDVASRAIVQVGFPVVVAGVLLWFVLGRFQDNMTMIVTRMSANTEAAAKLVAAQEAEIAEIHAQTDELKLQTALMQRFLDLRTREVGPKP